MTQAETCSQAEGDRPLLGRYRPALQGVDRLHPGFLRLVSTNIRLKQQKLTKKPSTFAPAAIQKAEVNRNSPGCNTLVKRNSREPTPNNIPYSQYLNMIIFRRHSR